jgi:hypothetical protein
MRIPEGAVDTMDLEMTWYVGAQQFQKAKRGSGIYGEQIGVLAFYL